MIYKAQMRIYQILKYSTKTLMRFNKITGLHIFSKLQTNFTYITFDLKWGSQKQTDY
jgi:hypothetical protein